MFTLLCFSLGEVSNQPVITLATEPTTSLVCTSIINVYICKI